MQSCPPSFGRTPALAALVLLALALAPLPSHAQYMYLDSNGDGVHTSADVLHGNGPTVVDVWLDTGHNRMDLPRCAIRIPPEHSPCFRTW
jgi:hypothetical protein